MQIAFIEAHKTGSSLVRGVEPNDIDICILFHNSATMEKFIDSKGGTQIDLMSYHDTRFLTCRDGEYNYICTADPELYYRTKAFSTALSMLQLESKEDRVQLAVACMDDDPEYVYEI